MGLKRNALFIGTVAVLLMWGCRQQVDDSGLMVQKEIKNGWTFRQASPSASDEEIRVTEWLQAGVPGTVHTDLMDNGVIEDPYYRLNEHEVQWIDKADWEYKTSFSVDSGIMNRDR